MSIGDEEAALPFPYAAVDDVNKDVHPISARTLDVWPVGSQE